MSHPDFDPVALCKELVRKGDLWADADAGASILEEAKKAVFSQALLIAEGRTIDERKAVAECSETYKAHKDAMVKARKAANEAKVRYDAWGVYVKLKQTETVNERPVTRMQ